MQALKCEMCGAYDIVKEGNVYVCQHCGTKYTVEAARNLLINGTIKIDTSEELRNLYELARRAKQEKNVDNGKRYYNMILEKDPNSWEAAFYSAYYNTLTGRIINSQKDAMNFANCISNVFKLLKENEPDEETQKKAVREIIMRCYLVATVLFGVAQNHYKEFSNVGNAAEEFSDRLQGVTYIYILLADGLQKQFSQREFCVDAYKDTYIRLNEMLLSFWESLTNSVQNATRATIFNMISENEGQIRKVDPNYRSKNPKTMNSSSSKQNYAQTNVSQSNNPSSGGCYIATAVYGSYDCPEVWTLRRYRDNVLRTTWYGRVFVKIYYSISPVLVRLFGDYKWFGNIWRPLLDRIILRLQYKGYKNTPYKD